MKQAAPDKRSPLLWSLAPPILGFIVLGFDKNLIGPAKEAFAFDTRTAVVILAVAAAEGWRNWVYPAELARESLRTLFIVLALISGLIAVCISIGGESSQMILYLALVFGAVKLGNLLAALIAKKKSKASA